MAIGVPYTFVEDALGHTYTTTRLSAQFMATDGTCYLAVFIAVMATERLLSPICMRSMTS